MLDETTDVSITKLRGQCYDGAAAMRGIRSGVAKRILDEEPRVVYTHCYGHEITGQNSNQLESNLSESQWLCHDRCKIQLDSDDRNAIIHGQRLNDKHINYAQGLLSDKFPDVAGLKSTLLQQKIRLDSSRPFVQILHVHNDHWITVSNLSSEMGVVYIYDSVYNSISS